MYDPPPMLGPEAIGYKLLLHVLHMGEKRFVERLCSQLGRCTSVPVCTPLGQLCLVPGLVPTCTVVGPGRETVQTSLARLDLPILLGVGFHSVWEKPLITSTLRPRSEELRFGPHPQSPVRSCL